MITDLINLLKEKEKGCDENTLVGNELFVCCNSLKNSKINEARKEFGQLTVRAYICPNCQENIRIIKQCQEILNQALANQQAEILEKIEILFANGELNREDIYDELKQQFTSEDKSNKICPICKTLTIFDIKTMQWTCPRRCKRENSKQ